MRIISYFCIRFGITRYYKNAMNFNIINTKSTLAILAIMLVMSACSTQNATPQMEGHYTYEHGFDYDLDGCHFDVQETGTMDFLSDGTALDSARQVYTVMPQEGDTLTWVFNYISPSRWHLDGDTLFFAGIKDSFHMELIEGTDNEAGLAQKIIGIYGGGIDYEYKFHLDTLTTDLLKWSFTYRDGHTDTWTFLRQSE